MKRLLSFMVVTIMATGVFVGCANLPDNLDGVWEAEGIMTTQKITIAGTSFTFEQSRYLNNPKLVMNRTIKDSREKGKSKGNLTITIANATSGGSAVSAAVNFSWKTDYEIKHIENEYYLKMKIPESFSATASMSENTYKRK